MKSYAMLLVIVALMSGSNLSASQSELPSRAPKFSFSIAERVVGRKAAPPKTELFKSVSATIEAAQAGDNTKFIKGLEPGAKPAVRTLLGEVAFSPALLQAIKQSCMGPYQYDEDSEWVQFSWVCSEATSVPIAKYFSFPDNPELTATVWLKGGLISKVDLLVPLWVPGADRISPGAYKGQVQGG